MKKTTVAALMLCATFTAQAASFEDFARIVAVQEKYDTTSQQRRVKLFTGSDFSDGDTPSWRH